MQTTLTIKCDIKLAQPILLAASKIIERDKEQEERRIRRNTVLIHNFPLSVRKWMQLDVDVKQKYICVDTEGMEFDIKVFDREANGMVCELCSNEQQAEVPAVIGTSDTREPKYCFHHYASINQDSRFVKKGVKYSA